MQINILGSPWTIEERSVDKDDKLATCDGYCDWTLRLIVIEKEAEGDLGDMARYMRKVKRHEIIHAFLLEAGLGESTFPPKSWACNEEMVDWLARIGPQIFTAWEKAGALLPKDKGG